MLHQNNLGKLLEENGSNQTQLAEVLGINRANVSRWVNEEREIAKSQVDAICDALGCTIEDLIPPTVAANEPTEAA